MPKFFGKVHPKYKTPYVAIILFAIVVGVFATIGTSKIVVFGVFALSGTFEYLALVATGSILLIDLGVSLAVLRLRWRDGLPKEGQFKLPLGPVIPLLSCAIVCWLLLQIPRNEVFSLAAMVGACVAIYIISSVIRGAGKKELEHR